MEILCKMFRQKCRYFSLSEIQIDEKIFKMRIQLCPTEPLREEGYQFPNLRFFTDLYVHNECVPTKQLLDQRCMHVYICKHICKYRTQNGWTNERGDPAQRHLKRISFFKPVKRYE
jgi:hypothetical protein